MPVGPPDNGFQRGDQLMPVKRFGQIAICSRAQSCDPVINAAVAGNHQYGDRHMAFPDQTGQAGSVSVRQIDVQKHRINLVMLQLIQSPFNGLGVDMVLTRLRQGNPYRIGDHGIIFNNQNIHEICSFSAVFSVVHPEKDMRPNFTGVVLHGRSMRPA